MIILEKGKFFWI